METYFIYRIGVENHVESNEMHEQAKIHYKMSIIMEKQSKGSQEKGIKKKERKRKCADCVAKA